MKWARVIAAILAVLSLVLFAVVAGTVWAYATEYGTASKVAAGCILIAGVALAVLLFFALPRRLNTRGRRRACAVVAFAILVLPALSILFPGRITYARFGLTVYGIIPVPLLDITVGPHRMLWFRDKTHHVLLKEVEPLLRPGVEIVIIGTGWNNDVQVDDAVRKILGPQVITVPTPDAYRQFNRCRSKGRKVVLLAHSTC